MTGTPKKPGRPPKAAGAKAPKDVRRDVSMEPREATATGPVEESDLMKYPRSGMRTAILKAKDAMRSRLLDVIARHLHEVENNLSTSKWCDRIGFSATTISSWKAADAALVRAGGDPDYIGVKDERWPTPANVVALAPHLGISANWVFSGEGEERPGEKADDGADTEQVGRLARANAERIRALEEAIEAMRLSEDDLRALADFRASGLSVGEHGRACLHWGELSRKGGETGGVPGSGFRFRDKPKGDATGWTRNGSDGDVQARSGWSSTGR